MSPAVPSHRCISPRAPCRCVRQREGRSFMGSTVGKWLAAIILAAGVMAAAAPPAARAADDPFLDFISPITDPTSFEDPRSQSNVRPIYVYHVIPGDFAQGTGLDGGHVNV